jgi:hypothetical protein
MAAVGPQLELWLAELAARPPAQAVPDVGLGAEER